MDADQIEQLVYQLYHDPANNASANKYLTLAQCSKDAWKFSWAFLAAGKPIEVQYFGASSLYTKISKCWSEVSEDEEAKADLRNRLMEALVALMTQNGSRVVQTRLQVAIVSYILHTVPNTWQTAINDLIHNLSIERLGSTIPPAKIILTLTELLMLIPEEYIILHLPNHEKGVIKAALMKSVDQVISVIESVLRQDPGVPVDSQLPSTSTGCNNSASIIDMQQLAIKCYSNWTQHLGSLFLGDYHEHMLDLILSKLSNEELISYVTDAIIGMYTHPEMHNYPNTVLKLIIKIVNCQQVLDAAIADENMDICLTLYNMYISIAENHSRLLLDTVSDRPENRPVIWSLISIILKCAATPGHYPVDETCSEQSLNFFYILQDDIMGTDQPKAKEYLELFQPLYVTLIDTLLTKVQFPPDAVYSVEWNSDDKETFRCYRQDIGDTFMYCYNMLRSLIFDRLRDAFNLSLSRLIQITSSGQAISLTERTWQPLEAVLFAVSSLSENLNGDENSHLMSIFESLTSIPFAVSERLLATAMEMIGSYCEWIYNNPIVLPRVLTLLLLGLKGNSSITTIACTMALKDITRDCQRQIEPYAPTILLACKDGLAADSFLKSREKIRLIASAGHVLSLLPQSVIEQYLNEILPPLLHNLQLTLKDIPQGQQTIARDEVVYILQIIGTLLASFDAELRQEVVKDDKEFLEKSPEEQQQLVQQGHVVSALAGQGDAHHPLLCVFQQIVPLLAQVGAKWINDEPIISSLAELLRKAVCSLLNDIAPIVDKVCSLAIQLYMPSCQASLLDVIKNIILLFHDKSVASYVVTCFSQFISHTVSVCARDLRNNTGLVECFFDTCSSIMKKHPSVFTSVNNISPCESSTMSGQQTYLIDNQALFRLACSALVLPEKPTVKAAANFITQFINKSRNGEELIRIVNADGEVIVGQIFIVIAGCLDSPRNVVEFMADILVALCQKYFDNLMRWFNVHISKEGFPSARVTKEQKEHFVRLVLRERKNTRKVKEYVTSFALTCRGLVANELVNSQQKIDLLLLR